MITTGEMFNPSDYSEVNSPKPRKQVLTDESAIAFLAGCGYDVSSLMLKKVL
jgi:hypothetical protein